MCDFMRLRRLESSVKRYFKNLEILLNRYIAINVHSFFVFILKLKHNLILTILPYASQWDQSSV